MRKIITSLLMFAAAFAMVACDNEKEKKTETGFTFISGTIADMPDGENYTLKLIYGGGSDDVVLASAVVSSSGAFTMTLPETVSASYLFPVEDIFSDVNATNDAVKINDLDDIYLELHRGEDWIDDVYFRKETSTSWTEGFLVYSDGVTKVTGSYTEGVTPVTVNIDLKKGWNWVFYIEEETSTGMVRKDTTTEPAGMTFARDLGE